MNRRLFFLLFLFFCSSSLWAQDDPSRYYDSGSVTERKIDTAALNERSGDKEFQYDRKLIERPNFLKRFIAWALEKLFGGYTPKDITLTYRFLIILVVVIALSLLIYYLSRITKSRLIAAQGRDLQQIRFLDFEGDSMDLEKQWLEAEAANNYPLALRYLFIKTLHFLKEQNIIEWKKEKTNGDYLRELKERWQRGPFQELSELFAYTQYGGYGVKEGEYQIAKSLYRQLTNQGKGEQSHGPI